jgi:DNA adenine methylase
MSNYSCETCGKEYKQKGRYETHLNKKKPCVPKSMSTIKEPTAVEAEEKNEVIVVKKTKTKNVVATNTTSLKPLIKWSGGKSDEIKQFEKYLPEHYDTYLEPFIGGGSLYFYLKPQKAVISDVHTELVDLYRCVGEGKSKEIFDFMESNPNTEETYYNVRDKMTINNSLDNAKRFYYQRKTCFRGMLRYNKDGKFNIPFGRYKTINYSELQNKEYEQLLSRTEVLHTSFEYIFENYNDENNFMFLDPPYDSEFTDYGYCQFGKEEQKRLAKLFKETKIKCLMVIGKTKFIEELYKDYIVDEYDKKYKFKLYAGRVGDEINTKHLIIKNY